MPVKKVKEWVKVLAPKAFEEKEIGKLLVSEEKNSIGRRIIVNALELVNNPNKYYLNFFFRVFKIENGVAYTEFDGFECTRDYISRMVLHKVKRMDLIQDIPTKDGVKLRVKSLLVAQKGIGEKCKKLMKKKAAEMILDFVQNSTVRDFLSKIMNDELKNRIFQELRKIYPLRYFEIRKVEVLR
jgi:small subunit ribosomal protein S3Ae